MIMEQSPIIDYYPVEFQTDLNGKQQEWEAVVLIPFIDEVSKPILVLLLKAIEIMEQSWYLCSVQALKPIISYFVFETLILVQ